MALAEQHDQQSYNAAAIRHAAALHDLRLSYPPRGSTRTLEEMAGPHNRVAVGIAREYEAMGNQPVSDELLARADDAGIAFEHLGVTLGTVLHGVDLTTAPDAALTALIRDTLLERKVIFFRDQHLTEDQHVAFGRCFGELDAFPFGAPGDNPFILALEHDEHSPGRENNWHSDVTWMERPSLGSIAQLMVKPPVGGDTLFADSHAAYHGLPEELRERLEHLSGENDYRVFLRGRIPDETIDAIKADIPFGVTHPLVRTHPETGKKALYLNIGFLRHDSLFDHRTGEPLGAEESKRIVTAIVNQHARSEYQCRFAWQVGSIAFWDNRAVQHYAASDYFPHRRLLRRVTVSGDRPFHCEAG